MLSQFKTKKALKEHAKKILNDNHGKRLSGDDLSFILELLKRHPEYEYKKGVGIKHIEVRRTMFGSHGFYIIRDDGTVMDFSYITCATALPATTKSNLIEAMRDAIKDQTIAFKKNNITTPFFCPLCRDNIDNYGQIHADHVVKFRTIAENFLQTQKEIPSKFDDCPIYHTAKFKKDDKHFENDWYVYHLKNSSLRLICSKCNSKEG